ncbi:leucine-rich repeat domain-containing protein [Clostridium tagluense]|uniref:leucine-rich repeat domain-containing protein n=1 Tax=Clostridium tagluense TaxID=360422 RepID=UPI001C6E7603|nr:leucine-rich repeat domain-containing protein [Clostridium tagluense]MBW9156993.1 leucine-rich repeat domain-containing protein [Clostridium tagluense]WLC64980.1 leucine-rich repeat domain-containing protein [Clostridium tagluense]
MNRKKYLTVLSTVAITSLILGSTTMAADGDVYNLTSKQLKYTKADYTLDMFKFDAFMTDMILNSYDIGYEFNKKVLKCTDVIAQNTNTVDEFTTYLNVLDKDDKILKTNVLEFQGQLNVEVASSINTTKSIGDAYRLPTTAIVTLSNGKTKSLAVTWDKVADTKTAGKFTFTGTLTMVSGVSNTKNVTISANLIVQTGVITDTTIVTFTDKNLEQTIRNTIEKPTGNILKSDVEKITLLNAIGITNLQGIEHLTNLTYLRLDNNEISNIEPLKCLTNLTDLYLSNNQISSIEPLKGLTNLKSLELFENQISNILPLASLTNLTNLYLSDNQINNIEPLKRLTNLKGLGLSNNQISNIDPLKDLTNLDLLYLSKNIIRNIEPLRGLTYLTWLHLSNNQITDYTPVSSYYNNLIGKDFILP